MSESELETAKTRMREARWALDAYIARPDFDLSSAEYKRLLAAYDLALEQYSKLAAVTTAH